MQHCNAIYLREGVDDDQDGPRHHAKAAVEEHLEVKVADAGVQLHAPVKVDDDASV